MDPKIWITTHALYNNEAWSAAGALIGYWLEPEHDDCDDESIFARLRDLVAQCAPSFAGDIGEEPLICAHEGWCGLDPETFALADLPELAALITTGGNATRIAILVEVNGEHYHRGDVSALESALDDLCIYEGDSEADLAYTFCEESGVLAEIPGHLRDYFDCEAYVEALQYDGWTSCRVDGRYYLVAA